MSWKDTKMYIKKDIYRNIGKYNFKTFLKYMFLCKTPISLLIYFRMCYFFSKKNNKNILQKIIHCFCYLRFNKLKRICGIELNQHTSIGYGLRLPHCGGIVIHPNSVIGNNCEIMQGVTIGNNILKSRTEVPIIGNEVLICSGAKIIGAVKIGDIVVIGANAVVNKDVDNNSIVVGIPAKFVRKCDNKFVINKVGL